MALRQAYDPEVAPKTAIIHGTGLIGSSIGLGLSAAGWTTLGWDPNHGALATAVKRGAIKGGLAGPDDGLDTAELVVLAGPLAATIASLRTLKTDALVTDVASIKAPLVAAGQHLARYVGGHPMAGSSASGSEYGSAHLFKGAKWVICNDAANDGDVDEMAAVVTSLGANAVVMSAADHDRSVALVSHLPRLLASALIDLASKDPHALDLSAGSFRDLTRVAGSGTDWWSQVLIANSDQVRAAIKSIQAVLGEIGEALALNESEDVGEFLTRTQAERRHFGAPVAEVRVVLFDRPGEIAKVGRALEQSNVDLRDLQIRHAEHGGGGILTLSVGESETEPLKTALAENGFVTEGLASEGLISEA